MRVYRVKEKPFHVPTIVRTGRELTAPGPIPDAHTARTLVQDLREAADTSVDLVLRTVNLPREWEDSVRNTVTGDTVLVVDRVGWLTANAQTFAELGASLMTPPKPSMFRINPVVRVGSAQLGTVLAVLAGRVLGQFDPLGSHRRLMLVAPNVLEAEKRLEVDSRDFRLWVTLHETTHRLQFAMAPWLRDYMIERVSVLVRRSTQDENWIEALKGGSLLDAITTPDKRKAVNEITAVMSVLEGHADVVMDSCGPSVIPTVAKIRRAFDRKRATSVNGLNRLLGFQNKLEQYTTGAAFIRGVVKHRGHAGLHPLWQSPENLPTQAELDNPELWLERIRA